mmetsp:Transcript_64995/g.205334  ORF Transcript_64995/g.205334 Transcript_64995/m.205334 type:complete len:296 (+) Transcript_64995:749-1636(+)
MRSASTSTLCLLALWMRSIICCHSSEASKPSPMPPPFSASDASSAKPTEGAPPREGARPPPATSSLAGRWPEPPGRPSAGLRGVPLSGLGLREPLPGICICICISSSTSESSEKSGSANLGRMSILAVAPLVATSSKAPATSGAAASTVGAAVKSAPEILRLAAARAKMASGESKMPGEEGRAGGAPGNVGGVRVRSRRPYSLGAARRGFSLWLADGRDGGRLTPAPPAPAASSPACRSKKSIHRSAIDPSSTLPSFTPARAPTTLATPPSNVSGTPLHRPGDVRDKERAGAITM